MVERFFVDRIVFSARASSSRASSPTAPRSSPTSGGPCSAGPAAWCSFAQAQKFNERGLNVVVPAGQVDTAYLTHPPPHARALESVGVDVVPV